MALMPAAPLATALLAFAITAWLVLTARASAFHRRLALVLASAGLLELGTGLAFVRGAEGVLWQRLSLAGAGGLAASVMWLGLSVTEGDGARPLRLRATALFALSASFAAFGLLGGLFALRSGALVLTPVGRIGYAALLICLVLALAHLESILRSTREPLRYRIKFVLLGVGGIAAFRIYAASQVLLFGNWPATNPIAAAAATFVSLALVAFGLARSRLREAVGRVSVSPQMIYGSLTVLVVGLYLIAVGLAGYAIQFSGHPFGVGLGQLVVFVGGLALAVAALSRSARMELRRFTARHFVRSRYDYRTKWLEVTDAFEASASEDSILDRLLDLLSRTFAAGRISVWLRFEADQRFHRVRSANIEAPPEPVPAAHPLTAALAASDEPLLLAGRSLAGAEGFLAATRAVVCVPIRVDRDLIAFIALSAAPHGEPYGEDDRDLLRAISRHVAVLLAHARLAEERRAAAELEALHRFSAFCMHDLKNLAARLSLVTQNDAVHGQDPAFREAAMKTIERTGREMSTLVAQLSLRSLERGRAEAVDLEALLREVLGSIDPGLTSALALPMGRLPQVLAVREQLQQVVLNVVLNARHALEQAGRGMRPGDFRVTAEERGGQVVVTVMDHGIGIPASQLRTLFQPLKTTKAGGLGIGLYESKRLVEASNGRLRVESDAGRGTEVRIELALAAPTPAAAPRPSSRAS